MDVSAKLRDKEIINNHVVLSMKKYISKKYPHLSSHEAASMFANSISRVIDNNIRHFDKEHREAIKKKLISDSIRKESFDITAYDVFSEIISYNENNNICMENLLSWVNENHETELSRECLLSYLNEVTKLEEERTIDNTQVELKVIANNNINVEESDGISLVAFPKNKYLSTVIGAFIIVLCSLTIIITSYNYIKSSKVEENVVTEPEKIIVAEARPFNELPTSFKYMEIDNIRLRVWLNSRNSLLADEPYLTTIVSTAEEFNVNPLLLIAIAGQEQGFVPRSNENAEKMANNPFNVFGSWMEYNTDIKDSSSIAARTIVNLSKDKPDEVHVIQWINRKYAEDQNWHKGVTRIFNTLSQEVGQPSSNYDNHNEL